MSARDEDKRLTVPKFASFKSTEPAEKSRGKDSDQDKSQDRDSRSKSHRSEKHHHSSHRRHESHRHDRKRSQNRQKKQIAEAELQPRPEKVSVAGVFVIDTKGDALISKYGGIDRSHVPAYYRYGAGRILGSEGRLLVHRDGPRDQFSIRMPGEGSSRDKEGLQSKRLRITAQPSRLRKRSSDDKEEETGEFLSVKSNKRKRDQEGDSSSDDDELPSYRAIDGKPKTNPDFHSDSESDSSSSTHIPDQNDPLQLKSMQLSRQVKDHPEDINAWLELVNHQDTLLRAGESLDRKALDSATHSYAEIKVSMLESALPHVSNPGDRSRVLVYLMREGGKVWSSKTAAKKWSEVSKDEEYHFLLWRTRLDFTMSNIASFQYDEIKKMLLDRLNQVLSRQSPEPPKADIEEAIYLFLRMTRFIHDAGYKELAVAAWQGFLELNFFRPGRVESTRAALDKFQDFWESEVPRIGDADAQGWGQYVQNGGIGDAPEPLRDNASGASHSRDPYKAWGSTEQLGAKKARMPARTMDEGTEEDPFRVVMYSDIEPLLFIVPESVLSDVTHQLIDAFLLFCGLPTAFQSSHWTELAFHDQFLTAPWGGIRDKPSWETNDYNIPDETSRRPPSFSDSEVHAGISADMLFSGAKWFQYLASQNPGHAIDRVWVLAVTRQLVHLAKIEDLAPIYMGLCFWEDPANIRKPSKALLKLYPANIALYYAYALAEYSNGKLDIASKVLRSAMEIGSTSEQSKVLPFWRTWSWIELEVGNIVQATRILCSLADENLRKTPDDGMKVSSAYILKAQQTLSSGFHETLAAGNIDGASAYAECSILLSYLTSDGCTEPTSVSQGNISAAMSATDTVSQEFDSWKQGHTAPHERVLQFASRLLYFNASKGPFRRVYMQENLSRFIDVFPRNTILLSLFEWSDSSLRVVDETRGLLYDKVLSPSQDCVSSRVFAVRHELARGNANSTKAAFENAFSSDACKGSVSLWISYIRFSQSQRELRGQAKDVFYRALRHCPWSKEVMMEAFVTLESEMRSDELRAVYDTMVSKALRIHVDLEEFLQRRKGASKGRI